MLFCFGCNIVHSYPERIKVTYFQMCFTDAEEGSILCCIYYTYTSISYHLKITHKTWIKRWEKGKKVEFKIC